MENLIRFSLQKQKPEKDEVSASIKKALAKIDRKTDSNLITAL